MVGRRSAALAADSRRPARAAAPGHRPVAVSGSVDDLVGRQCGVATRAQLRAAGVTDGQIRAAIAAQRWQAFGRTTVVMHNAVPIAGSPVLRFASATLRLEPTRVSDQLRRIRLAHTPR